MSYVDEVYDRVVRENPSQPEFHQAVREVLDSLRLNEELYPVTGEVLEIEGRKWFQAINAKGQDGYVSADYVQLAN